MFLVECFGFELSFSLFAVLLVFALLYLMLLIFGVLSWNKKPDKAGSGIGIGSGGTLQISWEPWVLLKLKEMRQMGRLTQRHGN